MKHEIRFAGFGGQGIVLCGYILGKAASLYDGKNAVFTQSYGPEARGGACVANIIISDTKIYFPKVQIPDILVLMSNEAYTTYINKIKPQGIVIVDRDMISLQNNTDKNMNISYIPATKIAEELNSKIVANMVMLGFFTAKTSIVSKEAVKKAILDSVPKGTEELNLTAFDKGYNYNE